ncbi:MAG: ABC transporter permease [Thermomicrobiales bacterium]
MTVISPHAVTSGSAPFIPRVNEARRWSLARFAPITEIELKGFLQTKSGLAGDLLVGPIVWFALFAAGIGGTISAAAGSDPRAYLTFVLPGFLVLQGFGGFTRMIYRTTIDRKWGLLAMKRLLGAGGLGYVLAMMTVPVISFLARAAAITLVAVPMDVHIEPGPYALAIVLTCALLSFWTALAILLTALIRTYQQRDILLGIIVLPMTFAAPVFYPLESAPAYLRAIALLDPLSYQVMAVRRVFDGQNPGWWLAGALATTGIVVVAAVHSVSRGELLGNER